MKAADSRSRELACLRLSAGSRKLAGTTSLLAPSFPQTAPLLRRGMGFGSAKLEDRMPRGEEPALRLACGGTSRQELLTSRLAVKSQLDRSATCSMQTMDGLRN